MEVHFTPEQETQLTRLAARAGTDAEHFVRDAALKLVEESARFRSAVRGEIEQPSRGELIDDDQVWLWLK